MMKEGENSVTVAGSGAPQLPFQLYETRPERLTWHMIFDHELVDMLNISRPLTLAGATLLLGGALGLLPSVIDVLKLVGRNSSPLIGGVIILVVAAGCLVGGLVAGAFAIMGQADARRVLHEVRGRGARPINPPNVQG